MDNHELDDDIFTEKLLNQSMNTKAVEDAIGKILHAIGENPDREGLIDTPKRITRMYAELLSGYDFSPQDIVNGAIFDVMYDEMVLVKNLEFYSLCEHHMLPFFGRVHVAYIPNGKVLGLSKVPRIVDLFASRLQVQERMTRQIADSLRDLLHPQGVGVVVEAMHLCMSMRGVKKQDARITTSAMHGAFRANLATRQEFLENIARGATPLLA